MIVLALVSLHLLHALLLHPVALLVVSLDFAHALFICPVVHLLVSMQLSEKLCVDALLVSGTVHGFGCGGGGGIVWWRCGGRVSAIRQLATVGAEGKLSEPERRGPAGEQRDPKGKTQLYLLMRQ
jgi:hypothetical protein